MKESYYIAYGADPNCDMGGSHVQPILGYFQGTYDDVLAYAKQLPNWFSWGGGGKIVEVKFQKIDVNSVAKRAKLLEKKKAAETELKELDDQLRNM